MRVLVAMDGSDGSWTAFDHAAEQFPDATLVCLYVINPVPGGSGAGMEPAVIPQWIETQEETAEALFAELDARADTDGLDVETRVETGRPTRVIVDQAADCDHVVVGSHGRDGVSRILLGSVAETVVRRSPVPVTVAR